MKKIMFFQFALFLAVHANYAQHKNNAVKLNPFGMMIGQYQLIYEGAISEKFSLQCNAGILSRLSKRTMIGGSWYDGCRTGFIIVPEARYYVYKALKGVYFSSFIRYRKASWQVTDAGPVDQSYVRTRKAFSGGLTFGSQFYLVQGLNMDVFIGPQLKSVTDKISYDLIEMEESEDLPAILLSDIDQNGIWMRVGLTIGYAF